MKPDERDHLTALTEALRAAAAHADALLRARDDDHATATGDDAAPWSERVWVVPGDTRLSLREAAAALGRSPSFLYHGRGPRARRVGRRLTYRAADLRAWLRANEQRA